MVKIIERLPYAIQTRWRKKATTARRANGAYTNIKEFLAFAEDCIEDTCDAVFDEKRHPPELKWHLPHHSVFNVNKAEEIRLVRVAFDCSSM